MCLNLSYGTHTTLAMGRGLDTTVLVLEIPVAGLTAWAAVANIAVLRSRIRLGMGIGMGLGVGLGMGLGIRLGKGLGMGLGMELGMELGMGLGMGIGVGIGMGIGNGNRNRAGQDVHRVHKACTRPSTVPEVEVKC